MSKATAQKTKMAKMHLPGDVVTMIDMVCDKTGKTRSEVLLIFMSAWLEGGTVKI